MRLHPLYSAEGDPAGGGTSTATFEVNGQQMTAEQVLESYKKLQGEFTKVTQENSSLKKDSEKVKPWVEFDKTLDDLTSKTGQQLKPLVAQTIDGMINAIMQGKAPTTAQMSDLGKAIDKADAKGDEETVQRLQALEAVAMEAQLDKTLGEIEKNAKSEGIDFDRKEFQDFADKWLEDLGIGDDDDFDLKLLNKAYEAFEAKKIKENVKKIPPLGTSGGAAGPDKSSTQENKVGGIKGAAALARELLK